MTKKLFQITAFCSLILLLSCNKNLTKGKTNPDWEDNFDQAGSFDNSKWSKIPRGKSDWNRNMSDQDSCFSLGDGKLI